MLRHAAASQATELQQEKTSRSYDFAPASPLAAESGMGKTVLGHYPEYTKLAGELGARRFNIPTNVWNKMTDAERWAANQKFLDRMINRGDDIILATPLDKVKPGSYFQRELDYLLGKGYKVSPDGTKLVPGSG
jgi:hypothetical protein